MTPPGPPDLLLLYTDRSDPVTAALLAHPGRFWTDVVAIALEELVDEVAIGPVWRWRGRTIDPARTAVVNRLLPSTDPTDPIFASTFDERQFWGWLQHELPRFVYATSLPTATSMHGCHGSLLDQWLDLPVLVGGLRVPEHRAPWDATALAGDVHRIDLWQLYSLGVREAEPGASNGRPLRFARPRGPLVHVAQVGGTLMVVNAPPQTTAAQQSSIVAFANAMAARSAVRILEHAFFVGDGPPVFYSTCPVPVITGALPDYPALLVQGLQDDIARRLVRVAANAEAGR